MSSGSSPVGSLARDLREASAELHAVEQRVDAFLESLLESLFLGWHARFPTSVGWRFTPPHTIDVYGITVPSPAAVDALRRAGFLDVTLHGHDAMALLACSCPAEPEPAP